jgi:hypothetical protein
MKIEERDAWQNKPHKTSKSRQKVNKVRMKIEERNAWQNKPHGDRKKECMAK